jgi:hypothetical protein
VWGRSGRGEIYKNGYKLTGSVIKRGVGSVLKGYDLILKRGKSGKNVIKRVKIGKNGRNYSIKRLSLI